MNACAFAIRTAYLDAARDRVASLTRFYAPLGPAAPQEWWFPQAQTLIGVVAFGSGELLVREDSDAVLVGWGGPTPAGLRSPRAVLAAGDGVFRDLDLTVALLAAGGDRARVVGAASGPVTLYAAESGDTVVWSTHAAAASLLARGELDIDWSAVPEYLAADSVGGIDTHLRGVRALPSASLTEVQGGHARERSYWPAHERWQLHGEADAYLRGTEALLKGLERRLAGIDEVHCALTAGSTAASSR